MKDFTSDPGLPAPILDWIRRRFDVEGTLGQGGSGRVYAAIHRDLERPVALKVILRDGLEATEDIERAQDEGRTQARLSHPNLVQIFEVEHLESCSVLVCERVDGMDLAGWLVRHHPVPIPRIVEILADVTRGLSEIHRHSFVHRDLKPGNILIERSGRARITDFGLATGPGVSRRTGAGVILGTPEYMAPEQILGSPTDARTDLYALGVIAYELLTGVRPFSAGGAAELMRKHLNETPLPVFHLRSDAPTWLTELIGALLSKDAGERPKSTDQVQKVLETREITGLSLDRTKLVKPRGAPSSPPAKPETTRTRSGDDPPETAEARRKSHRGAPRPGGTPVRARAGEPPVSPRRGGRRLRRALAAGAGLLTLVTGVTFWALRPRTAELRALKITLRPDQLTVEAKLAAAAPLEIALHPVTGGPLATGDGEAPTGVIEVTRTLERAGTGAGGRLVVLSRGAPLAEIELPALPDLAVPLAFRDIELAPVRAPLDRWEAHLRGTREDQELRLEGSRREDEVRLPRATIDARWRVVRLAGLRCVTSIMSSGNSIPCEVLLEPSCATRTLDGLGATLASDLERAWKEAGAGEPLPWPATCRVAHLPVEPTPARTAARMAASCRRVGASPEELRATHEWIAGCQLVLVGAIDGGHVAEVPVEQLAAPWVVFTHDPPPADFRVPGDRLAAFLPPELTTEGASADIGAGPEADMTGIESLTQVGTLMTLITPFVNDEQGILSPREGCPAALQEFKDPGRWVRQLDLALPEAAQRPVDGLRFETVVYNLERQQFFSLVISGGHGEKIEIPIFNRTDTYNIPRPGPGIDGSCSVHSWKNLRWTSRWIRLEIAAELLPAGPLVARLDYGRNPYAHDQRAAPSAIMGYQWIPGREE